MTAHPSEHTSHRTATVVLAALGLLAVAALMAAMVWVVQGQVQQAEVLRAQWQGSVRTSKVMSADNDRAAGMATRQGSGLMATSLNRP